jgi:hypothetical protein
MVMFCCYIAVVTCGQVTYYKIFPTCGWCGVVFHVLLPSDVRCIVTVLWRGGGLGIICSPSEKF